MRSGTITIGIMIVVVSIIIYLVKNQKLVIEMFHKLMKTKVKYIFVCLLFILIVYCGYVVYESGTEIAQSIRIYNKNKVHNELYASSDKKKAEENLYYKEIFSKEYETQNYANPYIPENFVYVEGTYADGFVIQDQNQNQYVWIPCTNQEIAEAAELKKKNFVLPAFISKDYCYDEQYEEFLKSALENGGFYISRFEIGKENNLPVSKKGVEVWNNVSRAEAKEIISNMYENEEFHCELINGFAYDTTLVWLQMNNEIEKEVINIEEEKTIYTGRNGYNRIYDFCDNILEITTETFYDNVIIRGFSGSEEKMELGIKFSEESRYSILEDSTSVSVQDGLSFRTILYK